MNIKDIIRPLIEANLATEADFQRLSAQEVEQFEIQFKVSFPKAYRDFLLTMGRKSGSIFQGTDLAQYRRLDLQQAAKELLIEADSQLQLPDDSFVFEMHQGYIFYYFRLTEGENPPVYGYKEGESVFKVISDSFTDYLMQAVQDYIRIMEQIRHRGDGTR